MLSQFKSKSIACVCASISIAMFLPQASAQQKINLPGLCHALVSEVTLTQIETQTDLQRYFPYNPSDISTTRGVQDVRGLESYELPTGYTRGGDRDFRPGFATSFEGIGYGDRGELGDALFGY